MYSALDVDNDGHEPSVRSSNRLDLLNPSRLKAAVMEAGTPFTPSYWQSRPGAAPSHSPEPALEHESDSENESSMTSPSGRLQSGVTVSSSPAVSNQTRNMFRTSPASKSPQSSFRLRNMRKSSGQLAEDSISLSNRSDSSDHQHHLVDNPPQLPVRRQPSRQLSASLLPTPQAVPRSAGRTRSPQRVAPAPGPSDGSSTSGREDGQAGAASGPQLDIFEPRPALSGGLEAVLGSEAEALGSMSGPELLTHMADGLPTGKTWVRGNDGLPSPSCTQGPCKSRSVRTINCTLDSDIVTISYSRKGFHGMMQKHATGTEQVSATVFRAQISPGEWHSNKPIMLLTDRGWLALHALSHEEYVLWVLGLNAILGLSQVQQRLYIEKCKVRDIPRSMLLVVQGS